MLNADGCASLGTHWRACSLSPTGWATQTMRASIGCSSTGIWARSMSGSRGDVEQLLATQPSELHALTADLSAEETDALLQRLLDLQGERERAKSPQQAARRPACRLAEGR